MRSSFSSLGTRVLLRSHAGELLTTWGGTPVRNTYAYAILHPPSETHHPLWKEAVSREKENGRKTKHPKYRLCATSTAL